MTIFFHRSRTVLLLLIAPLALSSQQAFAASNVPDAGVLLHQFQQITPPPAPTLAPPPKVAEEPTLPPKDPSLRIHVTDFEIESHIFSQEELKALIQDSIGKDLTFAELQALARKIGQYYRDHNYFARAILPRQTIKDGIVRIVVIESTLGQIKIDSSPETRANADLAHDVVAARAEPGQPLRPDELREGVARLNEIPGFSAAAELQPGANDRETDAVVKVTDKKIVSASLQENNESSRSVGRFRTIAVATLNNATGRGDQTSALIVQSYGSTYGRMAVTAPVHASGLTLGLNTSAMTYNVDEDFSSTDQDGYAYTGGMTALYALQRAIDHSVNLTASYDYKRLENSILDLNSSSKEIHVGSLGAMALFADHVLAGGTTSFNASITTGQLNLHGNEGNYNQDQASARTNGLYGKVNVSASRLQSFNDVHQLFISTSAQLAPQNLDTSEQMSLGGPEGVRAYPVNEAMGDQGFLGRIELRHKLNEWLNLFDFYDVGWIQQHQSTWNGWDSGSNLSNDYWLHGIGVGVSIHPISYAVVNATVAHTLGSNPGRIDGKDSDGYDDHLRFWLRASLTF
ncbi:MAG: ShlB/FhaC/HecB family hemolysin secretion/activation protein [Bdellovibrionales bacterium]